MRTSCKNAGTPVENPPEFTLFAKEESGAEWRYDGKKEAWTGNENSAVPKENSLAGTCQLRGIWLRKYPRPPLKDLRIPGEISSLTLDCSLLGEWDSSALIFVRKIQQECAVRQIPLSFVRLPDGMKKLLELSGQGRRFGKNETEPSSPEGLILRLGLFAWKRIGTACDIFAFIGEMVLALGQLILGRKRFQVRDLITQLSSAGPAALGIISLIGFLVGIILAFIGAIPLQWFGAENFVAGLVGIGILRLQGPVMVGVVMAGRTGAAYAAELGTMQTNEEIDAFRTLGISPIDFLVLPRSLALSLMMPFLCLFADFLGILGGALVAVLYLDLTWLEFYQNLIQTVGVDDLLVGLFSAFVFGILVAACGCYQGIQCGRNAEAVGKAATASVVYSIICIVIATALITVLTVILKV